MRRFSVPFSGAVSASANTASNAIGLQTGSPGRSCFIYQLIVGMDSTVADATLLVQMFNCSAFTAGSSITPQPLEGGNSPPAATTGASSAPTVTTTGQALARIPFNSRGGYFWTPADPDGRILIPPGGGTAGSLVVQNQQPGTVPGLTLTHQLYFAE